MNMATAFANIANSFSDANGGLFIDATATWPGEPVYDDGGSIVTPGTPVQQPCRVQFDAATQTMRAAEGFRETDVRLLILSGPFVVDGDVRVTVATGERAGAWSILTVQRDPVGIGWECRSRKEG